MDKNQLLFAMGVIKGILASTTDEDVKMSLNISLEFMGKALQGYEMCPPEEPDHPEELQRPVEPNCPEPSPVYANDRVCENPDKED